MRHVGCHLVSSGLGYAVNHIPDVLLRRPEADIHDESLALWQHHLHRQRSCDERCAETGVHHGGPPMGGLLPKRKLPGKCAVLDHTFIASPGGVDEYIEMASRAGNSRKDFGGFTITQMVTANPNNMPGKFCGIDVATRCENLEACLIQARCNASANATAGSSDECYAHRLLLR